MLLCCASIAGVAALFSSCNKNGGGDEAPVMTGNSIFVPNATDTVITVTLQMESDWQVSNQSTWFAVNPLSGAAGEVSLNISVLEANPELTEKVSSFIIRSEGDVNTQYFVIQDVTPGYNMVANKVSVSDAEQSAVFTFEGNVDFDAVPSVDWITVEGIESDSTLLADNLTYSKYKTYRVNMKVSANSGEVRDGEVALNGIDGETNSSFTVSQMGELVADYSKTFFRRTMGFRLTATSCGYCPIMAAAMKQAYEETEGRFVPFTIYCPMSASDGMVYDNWRYWFDKFEAQGWPTGVTNGYANLGNYQQNVQAKIYKELAEEAKTQLPANNLIGGIVVNDNGTIKVDLSIASKEAGTYTLGVFLMENGIIHQQNGGGSDYEHNFVVIKEFTENKNGDEINVSANSIKEVSYSMSVPASVENIDNCYVCVWIASDDTFTGTVKEPNNDQLYFDYGVLIDNVVNIPVGGFAVFEYEE